MLTMLLIVVCASLTLSALCSLMEAALFSVPVPHVKHLSDKGSRAGNLLMGFKEDIGRPISAILIINTISNTLGAAVAGAIVGQLYSERWVLIFSVVFTVMILCFSEIIPKQLGAIYAKQVSEKIAWPLFFLIRLLAPFVFLTDKLAQVCGKGETGPSVSMHEVLKIAEMGTEEGVLDHLEGSVIRNVVGLDRVLVKDILTPRVVVFRLPETTKLSQLKSEITEWAHTRVPLFREETPDEITAYVIQRDLFRAFLEGQTDSELLSFSRPLNTVSVFMRADKLLLQMFELGETICSVVDEHGGFAGLVTLEDIIEEIVGREIVDEYDAVSDLRSYAQILYAKSKKARTTPD